MKTPKNKLDIVIPVYGRADLLRQAVAAIDYPHNLILVDNASPKDSGVESVYQELGSRAVVVRNKTNTGFPRACNTGAARGFGEYVLFLNSDCVVEPRAIERTIQELEQANVGVVGLKLVFPKQLMNLDPRIRPAGKIQHVGISINIRGQVQHPFLGWPSDHKKPSTLAGKDVWAVTGAYLLIRKSLFKQVGQFCTDYGLGTYEDVDLCMAVHKAGKEVRVVVEKQATHYVGGSAESYQVQYPLSANRNIFFSRWQNTQQLQWSDWVYL